MDNYLEWRKRLLQIDLNALNDEQRREMLNLRIGLNMLGDEGARRLYEYLQVSRQQEEWRRSGQDPLELGKIVGGAYARASEGKTEWQLRLQAKEVFDFYGKALSWKDADLVLFFNGYDKEYTAYQRAKSPE